MYRPTKYSAIACTQKTELFASYKTIDQVTLKDGQAIHWLLHLGCQEGCFFNQKSVSTAKRGKIFTSISKNVCYLIMEEVSWTGNTNFNQLTTLSDIKKSST